MRAVRRNLAIALFSTFVGALGCNEPVALNVVVITLDTTRADALGAYGQEKPTSPRIDQMAREGVLFEDVVTSSPSTLPSHASIFTGKQPYAHGVRSNSGFRLAAEHVTLAERLHTAGYATRAEVAAYVLAANRSLDQGFEHYRDPGSLRDVVEAIGVERGSALKTRPGEEITDDGLDFLRNHTAAPFFLWLHYFDPHKPYAPPAEFAEGLAAYHGEIRRVDHQIGRVLDEIETLGLRERTLVVLTADHGEGQFQHGEETHSYFVYDSTMRVPLIFWGAQLPGGVRVPALVRTVDVAPTVLALLGHEPLDAVQGASLVPMIESPDTKLNLIGYGESVESAIAFDSSPLRFIRVGRWKYIHKVNPELYDVRADPTEVRNKAATRGRTVKRLRKRLEEAMAEASGADAAARVDLEAAELEELRALGYLTGPADVNQAPDLDSLELYGPDPNSHAEYVETFSNGWGYLKSQNLELALAAADELLRQLPDGHLGHLLRVAALQRSGRDAEAVSALRAALAVTPNSPDDLTSLGGYLMREGEHEEAEELLRRALALNPCASRARLLLSTLFEASGRNRLQLDMLSDLDPTCSRDIALSNARAFVLATNSDPELRDGAEALEIAQRLVAADGGRHPGYLDTLAAAHAELGNFARAIEEQERALALLSGKDLPDGVYENFAAHLDAYREGRPLNSSPR